MWKTVLCPAELENSKIPIETPLCPAELENSKIPIRGEEGALHTPVFRLPPFRGAGRAPGPAGSRTPNSPWRTVCSIGVLGVRAWPLACRSGHGQTGPRGPLGGLADREATYWCLVRWSV